MNSTTDQNRVRLALSTGEIFEGWGFGASVDSGGENSGGENSGGGNSGGENSGGESGGKSSSGEVVFNTAMCGYQESLTDPSYMGQILVQTAPMIGNTGINKADQESSKIQVSAMVVHEYVDAHSNYRATMSLHDRLVAAEVPGIYGVDTRAITQLLRSGGVVQGVISGDKKLADADLVKMARSVGAMEGTDFASQASLQRTKSNSESSGQWRYLNSTANGRAIPIGLIDCGVKENIVRCLVDVGCDPKVLPMTSNAADLKQMLLEGQIQGLFLSNGPGDPGSLTGLISTVRELVHDDDLKDFPIYGICLGHQMIALAHGATTYKLKFGHRGVNHPILDVSSGIVSITSQNHGFAVDAKSCLDTGLKVTHLHLNDGTVGGLEKNDRPIASMQFHPEASPGPHDAGGFFERFAAELTGMTGS